MTHWASIYNRRPSRYSVFLVKCSLRLIYAVHGYHEILLFVAPRAGLSPGGLFLFETMRGGFCCRRVTLRSPDSFDGLSLIAKNRKASFALTSYFYLTFENISVIYNRLTVNFLRAPGS